jgi:hypothetical protein
MLKKIMVRLVNFTYSSGEFRFKVMGEDERKKGVERYVIYDGGQLHEKLWADGNFVYIGNDIG